MSRTRIPEVATRVATLPDAAMMTDGQLLDAMAMTAELIRLAEAALAEQAGAVAARSRYGDEDSLSRLQGFANANQLIQHTAKLEPEASARLIRLGTALGDRVALTGETLPASHPHLTCAFTGGAVPSEAADLILTTIEAVTPQLPVHEVQAAERLLVDSAQDLPLRQLRMLCRQLIAVVDPDGAEPVEEDLTRQASMTIRQLADGKTLIRAVLAPDQAGVLLAAMNAKLTPRRQPTFDETDDEDGTEDRRPYAARMADALTEVARDSLTLDDGVVAGAPVTVVVTMTLDQLLGAGGTARIDGIDEPISAGTARRMAADAELIPQVLGTESEILDQGRRSRLATTAQRRALGTRDQGCIWGHCDKPPGQCEVAHLKSWASGGPTDLENLALMCGSTTPSSTRTGGSCSGTTGPRG